MYKKLNLQDGQAYLLTDKLYRRYFSGIEVDEGYLLISDRLTYFTDARYFYAVNEKLSKTPIKCVLYKDSSCIIEQIEKQNIHTLFLDYQTTTMAEYESYKQFNVQLKDGTKPLQACRQIKSQKEIQSIQKACQIIEQVVNSVPSIVKEGITEKQIADYIKEQVILKGAEGIAFDTIVAFGAHSAVPHHQTSQTPLQQNECILIDTGCLIDGYCSDITRTFFYGNPTKRFVDCYNAVKNANLIAIDNIKAGDSLKSGDNLAREYLGGFGIADFFTHSLGHGVGLAIHEQPPVSFRAEGVFENDMVFTIEPGVYFDGEFGIRVEDTVVLKEGRVKRLFGDSKDLVIIK